MVVARQVGIKQKAPIIEKIISYKKPILLSTGLSTIEEVEDTINYMQSKDSIYKTKNYLALLQCTSMYPIPAEDANLNVINDYKNRFNLLAGYSDHTIGTEIPVYSTFKYLLLINFLWLGVGLYTYLTLEN